MNTLVISDTHLHKFQQVKMDFLYNLFEQADQIIINGDFWDGYVITFDTFLNSKWNQLFPLMIAKNTIYLYGNHDKPEYSDSRVNQFSISQLPELNTTIDGAAFHFEHGHVLRPSLEYKYPFLTKGPLIMAAIEFYKEFGLKTFGRNLFLREIPSNEAVKAWKKQNIPDTTFMMTGHSHWGEHDTEANYLNSGFIEHGLADYIFIRNGIPQLYQESYK